MLAQLPLSQYYVKGESLMHPVHFLMEEHRLIERALTALERATNRLQRGEDVYLRFFAGTAYFINGYIDGCHHRKEEQGLFAALTQDLTKEAGPVAGLLAEHAQIRHQAQVLKQALDKYQAGDVRAKSAAISSAMGFIRLLRQHIYKEDNMLFPIANKLIPAGVQQEMYAIFSRQEFDRDGEELQAKYRGLVERLENECLRNA